MLGSSLAEIGITPSDFADICERGRNSTDISMEVVNQVLAMDDFLTFKKLMIKRNLELELEAIKALREETLGDVDDSMASSAELDKDMETHFMELSILYKQEEMEQAELESAIAMSIAIQEEQLRLASVASKAAEDKFDESPERKDPKLALSPEEVHRQIRENKKRAEDIFKKNKESLQENKSKQKEWQDSVRVCVARMYLEDMCCECAHHASLAPSRPSSRTKRSSAGRSTSASSATASSRRRRRSASSSSRSSAKSKRRRRRSRFVVHDSVLAVLCLAHTRMLLLSLMTTLPSSQPPQLAEKVQSATPEELKKAEAEERRNALRIALARRMKQDLLETSAADESTFKFQQVRLASLPCKARLLTHCLCTRSSRSSTRRCSASKSCAARARSASKRSTPSWYALALALLSTHS